MTSPTLSPAEPMNETELAALYAESIVYRALIEAEDPLKASEVARAFGRSDTDLKLARVALATSSHFTSYDRKWTLWTRYLDTAHTFDAILRRILNSYGQAAQVPTLAKELEQIYNRPREIYLESLPRFGVQGTQYFAFGDGYLAPTAWLFSTELELPYLGEVEMLYENFIADEEVFPYEDAAEAVQLSAEPASINAFLNQIGVPMRNVALQFLLWKRDPENFDGPALYAASLLESGASALINGTWIGSEVALKLRGHFAEISEREVSETLEADAEAQAQPLVIGDDEREQVIQEIQSNDEVSRAIRLLEEIFEVESSFRTYQEDLATLLDVLKTDDRVIWLGADRFRPQGTLPPYIFSVPGVFEIPSQAYYDLEGALIDQLLEREGFDGGLEREIINPLAQDVLDEEPVPVGEQNPPITARTVIKYHHKQIGTLPLCQFPAGFFPTEPATLETEFMLPNGQRVTVWVNNEARLLFGLFDWFQTIRIDSGAVFSIERQTPDRYLLTYNDESEPTMFISANRINDLMTLQQRAEQEDLPTFDIVREIMEHYRKGIEFLTLLTEVNVVRRTSREMVASLLSEYHCFFQRGGAWVFDSKKLSQGFDKSKRKYLIR